MSSFTGAKEAIGADAEFELNSLQRAREQIEAVKASLRDDPGRAYSVEFTAAAEILRERDPVQFRSLRSLLKTKLIRLGEFDRLVDQRRRERVEDRKRNRVVAAARAARAVGGTPHVVGRGVRVGRYLANAQPWSSACVRPTGSRASTKGAASSGSAAP